MPIVVCLSSLLCFASKKTTLWLHHPTEVQPSQATAVETFLSLSARYECLNQVSIPFFSLSVNEICFVNLVYQIVSFSYNLCWLKTEVSLNAELKVQLTKFYLRSLVAQINTRCCCLLSLLIDSCRVKDDFVPHKAEILAASIFLHV